MRLEKQVNLHEYLVDNTFKTEGFETLQFVVHSF
jgi:hypothetical protein